jgi:predicted sulfurtransferase
MGILSLIGRRATNSVWLSKSGNGQRMIFTAVEAFQREASFVRHRNSMGAVLPSNVILPLASSSSSEEGGGSKILTNQDLVERRLAVNRGKRAAKERSAQERVSRNMNIKRLLHSNANGDGDNSESSSFQVPPLYAVKIWVDDELREELKLSGREKRGRVFLEEGSDGTKTFRGMKDQMFGFFRALRKNTFLLTANLPRFDEDGNVVVVAHPSSAEDDNDNDVLSWKIETDEDVVKTFAMADEYFQNSTTTTSSTSTFALKRPSVQINVRKDPNAPLPPPPPAYLNGMPDPTESGSMTMLSFYAFPPSGIADAEVFALDLKRKWKPFQALGRIYVATEGVNAQMSVPTNVLPNFMDCCRSVPELGQYMENDINIDPKPLSQEEFSVAGVPINGKPAPPFRNLHIRVRTQVVADGLDKSLNWQSAGYDMPPLEWHEQLKRAREAKNETSRDDDSEMPVLLDCRNNYETDVGIFEGAEPLGTDSFRDSWDVLKNRLADTPKDAPIMTYCTGGIRCKCLAV